MMSNYIKLRKMVKESGWEVDDDEVFEHLSYHFFLESICADLVNEYGVDEVVSAMCDEDGEDDGSTD